MRGLGMKKKSELVHVGLTVADLNRTYEFYHKYFGFELLLKDCFDADYIRNLNKVFRLEDGIVCDFAFIKAPDGGCLELFNFKKTIGGEAIIWNRPGYHHICLDVPDVRKKYEEMLTDGIEFCFEPRIRLRTNPADEKYYTFLYDPDGNYVELH